MNEAKINEVIRIINNALLFDDNSDFATALWEALAILKPELFENDSEPELEYIKKVIINK